MTHEITDDNNDDNNDERAAMAGPDGGLTIDAALAVLGLRWPVSPDEVTDARRRLAKRAHPDVGGSTADMALINTAAELVLGRSDASAPAPTQTTTPDTANTHRVARDFPSFVIEALPVEAFEALLVVASWIGDVIDDEPPYRLDVALDEPAQAWCQLDLVPDAGASTVSIRVGGPPGEAIPDVESVRDRWVSCLNQLDWDDLQTPS